MSEVGGIWVRREDFYLVAWTAPMRDLAAKVGISNVALRKRLAALGISVPPQGHWNKVQAGRRSTRRPTLAPRGPGECDPIWVGPSGAAAANLAPLFVACEPPSQSRPFASAAVPEDLDELRRVELAAIGKGYRVRSGAKLHPAINDLFGQAERFRRSFNPSHRGAFADTASLRHLAIVNAIFRTLTARGHRCFASELRGRLTCGAVIGDVTLHLAVALRGRKFPAGTNLLSAIPGGSQRDNFILSAGDGLEWADDAAGDLEDKIAEIAVGMIVAAEAAYRRSCQPAPPQIAAAQDEVAAYEVREREAGERARREALGWAGELVRQADILRALAEAASSSIAAIPVGGISYDARRWSEAAATLARAIDYPLRRLSGLDLL